MATWLWTYGRCRPIDDLVRECIRFYNYYVAKPSCDRLVLRWCREDETPVLPPAPHLAATISGYRRHDATDPGYRGVYPLPRTLYGRHRGSLGGGPRTMAWVVRYYDLNKRRLIHGGVFQDPIEAARAWDRMAIFYRREKSELNFPEECA